MSATMQWMWGDRELRIGTWSKSADMVEVLIELQKHQRSERPIRIHAVVAAPKREREMVIQNIELAINVLSGTLSDSTVADETLHDEDECRMDSIAKIDRFRLQIADDKRTRNGEEWPPPENVKADTCLQCIHCGASGTSRCDICGLTLCKQCTTMHPRTVGPNAVDRVKACRMCSDSAAKHAQDRASERQARADAFREVLAGRHGALLPIQKPELEEAEDCAGCALQFEMGKVAVGKRRHHCRACGRSLCASCLCGKFTCMGTSLRCPHRVKGGMLPQYGYDDSKDIKICNTCLPVVQARNIARDTASSLAETAVQYMGHYCRLATYADDPEQLPLYQQEYEDTALRKLGRVGDFAVEGVKAITPFVSTPAAIGIRAVTTAWKYGKYGLAGLFFSQELMDGIVALNNISACFEDIDKKELMVGALYLNAEQRHRMRSAPEGPFDEATRKNQAVDVKLLDLLIDLAGVGIRAPYEENAFEAQRLAMQQNWRPVTERLADSGKHRPAWCLFIHDNHKIACIAIRGTDPEKSGGGDIITDLNALPERAVGEAGASMIAHSGMLTCARNLEREIRQMIRLLCNTGFTIAVVGHSLGAGTAALLMWLLKNGADGEMVPPDTKIFGIGYATPAVVDRDTAEGMKAYFHTVVNSLDLVPRLCGRTVKSLATEIVEFANNCKEALNEDVNSHLDRMASLWAPRLRTGRQDQPGRTGSIDMEANVVPVPERFRRYLSKTLTGIDDGKVSVVSDPFLTSAVDTTNSSETPGPWDIVQNYDLPSQGDVTSMSAEDIEAVKSFVIEQGYSGFSVYRGKAYIKKFDFDLERRHLVDQGSLSGVVFYIHQASNAVPENSTEMSAIAEENAVAPGATVGEALLVPESERETLKHSGESSENQRSTLLMVKAVGQVLLVPGGPDSILSAWFGDRSHPWQHQYGTMCTEQVKKSLSDSFMLTVSESLFGDPCPKVGKSLYVLVDANAQEWDLYCPGKVVYIYRHHGTLAAAEVPCDIDPLRTIIFEERILKDHLAASYFQALIAARASLSASEPVIWQSFDDAGDFCPCCHNVYEWKSTCQSKKQRWLAMTNCRSCGRVVCDECAQHRQANAKAGILEPSRVCDTCYLRGQRRDVHGESVKDVFAALGNSTA